jgi:hypothetical protein
VSATVRQDLRHCKSGCGQHSNVSFRRRYDGVSAGGEGWKNEAEELGGDTSLDALPPGLGTVEMIGWESRTF